MLDVPNPMSGGKPSLVAVQIERAQPSTAAGERHSDSDRWRNMQLVASFGVLEGLQGRSTASFNAALNRGASAGAAALAASAALAMRRGGTAGGRDRRSSM